MTVLIAIGTMCFWPTGGWQSTAYASPQLCHEARPREEQRLRELGCLRIVVKCNGGEDGKL